MIQQSERNAKAIRFSFLEDDVVVGRAWLYVIQNDLHANPYGLLEDVFVEASHRGRGIATQLIQSVIQSAKEEKCYKLIATSRAERWKVHDFYVRLGFGLHGIEFRIDL